MRAAALSAFSERASNWAETFLRRNGEPLQSDDSLTEPRRSNGSPPVERTNHLLLSVEPDDPSLPSGFETSLFGSSTSLREVRRQIAKFAPTNANVLITGETGTGKELAFRDLHANSTRSGNRPVIVNCAAIPHDLLELELFGNEKGAYTDAGKQTAGKFDAANGGTLFLDEIGELSQSLQTKLRRAVEYGVFQRVGGTQDIKVNVRVIAATNRDIDQAVNNGDFSRGLYDSLSTFRLHMPPLRDRIEDIGTIAAHLIERNRSFVPDKLVTHITPPAIDILEQHGWPGNVRELENVIRRGMVLAKGRLIAPDDIAITRHDAVAKVLQNIDDIALSHATVLISGESGVGKELVARYLLHASGRSEMPFVVVNCATLHDSLAESELFGHVKGAFTGAQSDHRGFFDVANGGTIFLDQIGDLPLRVQPKLLRAIQEGEIEVVGSTETRRVNVRIIAATNRDLEADAKDGRFREDLLHRLSPIPVTVPPLRDRTEEIPDLAIRFLKEVRGEKNITGISEQAIAKLVGHSWPGNVRELKKIIQRAVILADEGRELQPQDICFDSAGEAKTESTISEPQNPFLLKLQNELVQYALSDEAMDDFKLRFLFMRLRLTRWISESKDIKCRQVARDHGMCDVTMLSLFSRFGHDNYSALVRELTSKAFETADDETARVSLPSNPVVLHHLGEFIDYACQDGETNDDRLRFLFVKCRMANILAEHGSMSAARLSERLGRDHITTRRIIVKFDYENTNALIDELVKEIEAAKQ